MLSCIYMTLILYILIINENYFYFNFDNKPRYFKTAVGGIQHQPSGHFFFFFFESWNFFEGGVEFITLEIIVFFVAIIQLFIFLNRQ